MSSGAIYIVSMKEYPYFSLDSSNFQYLKYTGFLDSSFTPMQQSIQWNNGYFNGPLFGGTSDGIPSGILNYKVAFAMPALINGYSSSNCLASSFGFNSLGSSISWVSQTWSSASVSLSSPSTWTMSAVTSTVTPFTSTAASPCEVLPTADDADYDDEACEPLKVIALTEMGFSITSCSVGSISYTYETGANCDEGTITGLSVNNNAELTCGSTIAAGTYTICLIGSVGSSNPRTTTVKFDLTVTTENATPTWSANFSNINVHPL